jgi:ribosomal protein S10
MQNVAFFANKIVFLRKRQRSGPELLPAKVKVSHISHRPYWRFRTIDVHQFLFRCHRRFVSPRSPDDNLLKHVWV